MSNQEPAPIVSPFFGTNRTEAVPTGAFTIASMKSLFAAVQVLSIDARKLEFSKLTRQPKQTAKEFEDMKKAGEPLFVPQIFLTTKESDMFSSDDSSIFDDPSIPQAVKLIVIDSCPDYMVKLNRRPSNWLRIELDLTKPDIFNLNLTPSEPTPNQSNFRINGEDANWSKSAHSKLSEALAEARTYRGLLHRRNIYDIYMVFGVFPVIFLILLRVEYLFAPQLIQLPTGSRYILLFWLIMLLINVFRILFNYTRWVFPYIEFAGRSDRKPLTQITWAAIVVPILGGIVWQAFISFTSFLIGR